MKTISQSRREMRDVLPKKAKWIKDAAAKFNPHANEVITKQGHTISYDFLVIAVGLQLNYGKVTGFFSSGIIVIFVSLMNSTNTESVYIDNVIRSHNNL